MKKLAIAVVSVIVIAALAWACSHVYRTDVVVSSITYYGIEQTVYFDAENGHRYAFDVIDGENLYHVNDEMNIVMWDNLTPEDPTDDMVL